MGPEGQGREQQHDRPAARLTPVYGADAAEVNESNGFSAKITLTPRETGG